MLHFSIALCQPRSNTTSIFFLFCFISLFLYLFLFSLVYLKRPQKKKSLYFSCDSKGSKFRTSKKKERKSLISVVNVMIYFHVTENSIVFSRLPFEILRLFIENFEVL